MSTKDLKIGGLAMDYNIIDEEHEEILEWCEEVLDKTL